MAKINKKQIKKPSKVKTEKHKSSKLVVKKVKPNVRKSLDSLKEDIYGLKTAVEDDTPEKRAIQIQTIMFELAAIKQLMNRVSTQLKVIEDHIEEIKNQ